MGKMEMKNISYFQVAKFSSMVFTTDNLWTRVVNQKYIFTDSLLDWIRNPTKKYANCSIIWKATLQAFDVVRDGLAWLIGDGTKVRLGVYPWPSSQGQHRLSPDLVQALQNQVFFHLNQVARLSWMRFDWNADLAFQWTNYVQTLKEAHIVIVHREDEFI